MKRTIDQRTRTRSRSAYTLIEMMVSMGTSVVLLAGLGSSIFLAGEALNGQSQGTRRTDGTEILNGINADISHAVRFTERTATSVTFEVPDRNGDLANETIRYHWTGAPNKLLEYTFNGGPPTVLASNVEAFNLSYLTRFMEAGVAPGGSPGLKVLLVVSSDTSPNAQELTRKAQMETWGFVVSLIDDSASQSEFDTAVASNDVAYVPITVTEGSLGTKLRNAAIGVVNEHVDLIDEFGFAAGGDKPNGTDVEILDTNHYVTETFSTGPLTILSTSQKLLAVGNSPSTDLTILGEFDQTGANPGCMVALAAGGSLEGGGNAAARRFLVPWAGETAFDVNTLTQDGRTIMKRSIEWASGLGSDGPQPPANFGYESIFTVNLSDYSKGMIATQVTLAEDGELSSITAHLDGKNGKKYEFAIYTDAGGEPGSFLINSNSGNDSGTGWKEQPVVATPLTAGTYWLAMSMEHSDHNFYSDPTGGQTRIKVDHDAIKNGWPSTWPGSTFSNTWKISIYGTYIPQ